MKEKQHIYPLGIIGNCSYMSYIDLTGNVVWQCWPKFDSKLTVDDDIAFVIQVNGKKRGLILSKRDTDQKKLFMKIMKEKNIAKYIDEKKIQKKIFVPNKLINILL